MFCLLVVLVKLSVLVKYAQLSRKTTPRKPIRVKEIISTKPRPKIFYDFLGLVIVLLLYDTFVSSRAQRDISYSCGMI